MNFLSLKKINLGIAERQNDHSGKYFLKLERSLWEILPKVKKDHHRKYFQYSENVILRSTY